MEKKEVKKKKMRIHFSPIDNLPAFLVISCVYALIRKNTILLEIMNF